MSCLSRSPAAPTAAGCSDISGPEAGGEMKNGNLGKASHLLTLLFLRTWLMRLELYQAYHLFKLLYFRCICWYLHMLSVGRMCV